MERFYLTNPGRFATHASVMLILEFILAYNAATPRKARAPQSHSRMSITGRGGFDFGGTMTTQMRKEVFDGLGGILSELLSDEWLALVFGYDGNPPPTMLASLAQEAVLHRLTDFVIQKFEDNIK